LRYRRPLGHLRIGVRLRAVFACVAFLMFAGSGFAVWQFQRVRDRVHSVFQAEERMTSVVRIDNSLLTFMSRLHRAADGGQPERFEAEATALLEGFRAKTAGLTHALRDASPGSGREALLIASLSGMVDALPARVSSLVELARAGDWTALHARLTDQVDHTDDVAEALMQDADAELALARNRLLEDIDGAEREAIQSIAITSLLSFLAAALLALMVTRSITEPLAALDAGSRALAEANFSYQIAVTGTDELANLAMVFNRTSRDLSDLYARIRHNETQLRLITDSLPVLISYIDRQHRYVFNNRPHEEWFRQPRRQLIGRRVEDMLDEAARGSFRASLEQALRGQSVTYETSLSHQEAGERYVRTTVVPDFDEQGEVHGFVSLTEDITADKEAEAALRASEERLQDLLVREQETRKTAELLNRIGGILSAELDQERLTQSLTEIAVELVGAEFGAFFYNGIPGQEQIPFCTAGERHALKNLALLRATPLWPPGRNEKAGVVRVDDISNQLAQLKEYPARTGQEARLQVKSYLAAPVVSRFNELLGTLIFGHSDAAVFSQRDEDAAKGICAQAAVALDNARLFEQVNITNRALRESNRALQSANDDLSVFAFSASHDLQEPLRNLSLYSQMLKRRYGGRLDPDADEFIDFMVEGAERTSELVSDLLAYMDVSNAGSHVVHSVPAAPVIQSVLANLQTAIRTSGASVAYNDLPAVAVEAVHLQQLFQNLIGNAIKYRGNESPEIRISAEREGENWRFSVKDNGIGIDPRYCKQVFGPFKRLHSRSEYPGTGIGLAICQKIIERYGGRIWVESELGKGSDFKFTLPQED
jgi:PAS domain S-box-containing protein